MSKGDPELYYDEHVFVCTNRRAPGHKRGSCAERGAEYLRDYMKKRVKDEGLKKVRINVAGCLDRCEMGPCVLVYPEGVWYSPQSPADCDEIITTHLKRGGRVKRLMPDAT